MKTRSFRVEIAVLLAASWSGWASVLSVAAAGPAAGEAKVNAGAPRIEFQSTEFDFGKVNTGDPVKHEFIFTNTGTATLEIKDVKPGCGCTTPGHWDREVAPGKVGIIPLQFNSTGFGGTVAKSATVTCNDPQRPTLMLTLKGTVWRPIEVTPSMAVFQLSPDVETNETRVVRIVNNLDEPLTLSEPECTNRSFRAMLKPVREGKEFELHVTSVPPFSTPTTMAPVIMRTSSARTPQLSVMAYAIVQPAVVVQPERLYLPAGPLKTSIAPSVSIRNNSTNAIVLSDPKANLPDIEVRLQEVQPGKFFTVSARFPEGFQLQPGQKVEVTLKSNHPKFPVLTVPVFQSPMAPAQAAVPGPAKAVPQALPSGALPARQAATAGPIQVPQARPAPSTKP